MKANKQEGKYIAKKYRVTLTESERGELGEIIGKRSEKALPVRGAYILPAEEGSDTAARGKKREVFREKIPDGNTEAHPTALRCSGPPPGYATDPASAVGKDGRTGVCGTYQP